MKKPSKKPPTLTERLKKLEQIVKKQDQKIKELEHQIRQMDLDEITELNDKLNQPSA